MKLIISILAYGISIILVGFTGLFALVGEGLFHSWPQHLSTLAHQFDVPKRAPFAFAIVAFVVAVPVVLGVWHWLRLRAGIAVSLGTIAGATAAMSLGGYGALFAVVMWMANVAPAFSVMEGVNLQFGLMLLGAWSVLAVILAMPAGAVVNRLCGDRASRVRAGRSCRQAKSTKSSETSSQQ